MELMSDRMRVEWDTNNAKQTEQYKKFYQKARNAGRKILCPNDGKSALGSFREVLQRGGFVVGPPELTEGQFFMRLYNQTGDTRLIWDSGRPNEVQEAAKLFAEYLEKGWRAFAIDTKGNKTSRRIYGFDPKLEEVYFDDKKTVKERLRDFVTSFKEIQMTPKSTPG